MTPTKGVFIWFLFVSTVVRLKICGEDECTATKFTFSKCYNDNKYLWVIEIPESERACVGKTIPPPRSAPCDFACAAGRALNTEALACENCPEGSFSLGGGQQYTFDETKRLEDLKDLTINAIAMIGPSNDKCVKDKVWRVKGSILQGDVLANCALELKLRFKLIRPGAIRVNYNLPTSSALATITSRCDFDVGYDDDDGYGENNGDELKRRSTVPFPATGYGVWTSKIITIREPGDYVFTLFTMGINALHFPFSIRSIIVEGNTYIQECTPCPPGTYASISGSSSCKSCPENFIAPQSNSTRCRECGPNEYSDDSSTKCLPRPRCGPKDFQRNLKKCENNKPTFEYVPVEPKICTGSVDPPDTSSISCGVCNPGMFKKESTNTCEFCPAKTFSDGTGKTCQPCSSELSLVVGLYYKHWDTLPIYFNRTYINFEESAFLIPTAEDRSWVPSVTYISSQAIPDVLSALSLTVVDGFLETSDAKFSRTYGTLSFKFSAECQTACELVLVAEEIYDDGKDDWVVLDKWFFNSTSSHEKPLEYSYSVPKPSPVVFSWLFTGDANSQTNDEIRIHEINVTNTKRGGSDRCVACFTANNQLTECQSCGSGSILSNGTCVRCPPSTIATRRRSTDIVPNVCRPCPQNMVSDNGVSCYVPCLQNSTDDVSYDLKPISTLEFHASKLFTQKGSGYFHVFNATLCGQKPVTCQKEMDPQEKRRSSNPSKIESQLCRMGVVPNANGSSVTYLDDFGEELVNASFFISKYFPPLRSDFNLTDLTLIYRVNSSAQSTCSSRITSISLRCDQTIEDEHQQNVSNKYILQTPNGCSMGTCDGCHFHFLLRTPFACPICDEKGYRIFRGPCKFGRQEVRKIPFPYCAGVLVEKAETQRCSMFSVELQILIVVFLLVAVGLTSLVAVCWRKNRKLEYRYMQLVENTNPDDDTPADNVCAQISDEEEEEMEEVQFKKTSRTKKIFDAVRYAIRKEPDNRRSDAFARDSFLLNGQSTNDA